MALFPPYNADGGYHRYQQDTSLDDYADPSPQQAAMPVGVNPVSSEEPLVVGGESPTIYSPSTLDNRATRFKYGLGDLLQKSKEEIYQDLQEGKEPELRTT